MSVVLAVSGTLQQPASLLLPDLSINDVLTHPVGTSNVTVIGVAIANADTAAQKVEVWWNDGTTDFLLFVRSVPATETVTVALDAPILLYAKQTAKKIRARAAMANVVTVTVSYTLAAQQRPDAG